MTTTSPKPFVFVLMPFASAFRDVYHLGIKSASEIAGCYCERVDEQVFDGTILDRIYNQIKSADIIVADMTGRNANVFYEVGYAHALDKRVILLTQHADDIPFDLKHYPHIVYDSVTTLRDDLGKRLLWIVQHPGEVRTYFSFPLRLLSGGHPVTRLSTYTIPRDQKGALSSRIALEVDILNSPDQMIATISFRFGLVLPKRFGYVRIKAAPRGDAYDHQRFVLGENEVLHLARDEFQLLPGALEKIAWIMDTADDTPLRIDELLAFRVRILTEMGIHDETIQLSLK